MQLISIPGDTQVNVTISHFQPLSDLSKYQDPFYTLLKYIATVSVLEAYYVFVICSDRSCSKHLTVIWPLSMMMTSNYALTVLYVHPLF